MMSAHSASQMVLELGSPLGTDIFVPDAFGVETS